MTRAWIWLGALALVAAGQFAAGGKLTGVNVAVTITSPTSAATYDNGTSTTLNISGTVVSDARISYCSYNDAVGSGLTTLSGNTWSKSGLTVANGTTVIVSCTSESGPTGQDSLTVTVSSGLPSGVTLSDPDGGLTYYNSFSNATPLQSASFFPIAVFDPYDLGATRPNGFTRIAGDVDAGINVYIHLGNGSEGATTGGTDIQKIMANGNIYLFADPTQTHVTGGSYLSTNGSRVIGWGYQDETEGGGCGLGEGVNDWITTYSWIVSGSGVSCTVGTNSKKVTQFVKDTGNYLRGQSPGRMVYQGYTNGFAFDWFIGGPVITLAQAGDVIGYDVYVLTDRRSTFGGAIASVGHVWAAYESIMSARTNANFTVPIWPDLETDKVDTDSGMNATNYSPTDAELTALPWHYIIGGARGLTWFPYCFCATPTSTSDVINDTTNFPTRHATIKAVNAKVQSLASVINAQFANGYVTASSTVNKMAKYVPGDGFYVFAAIKQSAAATPTFTIAGSPTKTVTVMFESRTISMTNGTFSDSFTGETGWHVYRIPYP